MSAELIAGALAGVAGLLTFLVIHHFWITPIWFILPVGLVMAAGGGLVVGWSYAQIRTGLPPAPWNVFAMAVLIGATLAPSIVIAQLREPLLDVQTFTIPAGQGGRVALRVVLELLLTATAVGGLAGWWLGRTRQAALATALAGLVFAIGPGHNIPLLGNTPVTGKGLGLLVAVTLASAIVLVGVSAWLGKE